MGFVLSLGVSALLLATFAGSRDVLLLCVSVSSCVQIRAIALASPQSLLGVGLRGVHIVTALSYYWLSLWTDKITVSELATRQDSERVGDFHIAATVVSVAMQGMQHDPAQLSGATGAGGTLRSCSRMI